MTEYLKFPIKTEKYLCAEDCPQLFRNEDYDFFCRLFGPIRDRRRSDECLDMSEAKPGQTVTFTGIGYLKPDTPKELNKVISVSPSDIRIYYKNEKDICEDSKLIGISLQIGKMVFEKRYGCEGEIEFKDPDPQGKNAARFKAALHRQQQFVIKLDGGGDETVNITHCRGDLSGLRMQSGFRESGAKAQTYLLYFSYGAEKIVPKAEPWQKACYPTNHAEIIPQGKKPFAATYLSEVCLKWRRDAARQKIIGEMVISDDPVAQKVLSELYTAGQFFDVHCTHPAGFLDKVFSFCKALNGPVITEMIGDQPTKIRMEFECNHLYEGGSYAKQGSN